MLRLWSGSVPEDPTLKEIRTAGVIGLIVDFQERRDPDKELRLLEYDSAYPPVLGPRMCVVVFTLHQAVARWMRRVFARKQLSMQTCVLEPHKIPRSGPIDPNVAPRRALLEAMLHARNDADLPLVTNALRALRRFEGNELLIYREMLLTHLKEEMIMQAHLDLEYDDYDEYDEEDDGRWDDYEPTEEERQSFMYRRGERAGREDGRQEGRREGRQEALALAVVDVCVLATSSSTPQPKRRSSPATTMHCCEPGSPAPRWPRARVSCSTTSDPPQRGKFSQQHRRC